MSGGSYDYAYLKIEDLAHNIKARASTPERSAFVDHLFKIAKAAHDIEWVDSGDCGPGDENQAIRACLVDGAILDQMILDAKKIMAYLTAEIDRIPNPQRADSAAGEAGNLPLKGAGDE